MQTVYTSYSGHEFAAADRKPITIYTESLELDGVTAGVPVTDNHGNSYLVVEKRHISGRLFRIELIPA